MKKIIMGSVLAIAAATSISANAATVTVCSGGAAGSAAADIATAAGTFVVVPFRPKCSANVVLHGDDVSSILYKVGAASLKGKFGYGGSTAGGAVSSTTGSPCSGACSATDAAAALTAAPNS